ncbi:hypothetical protein H4R35_005886 [Dimargaris xerosporica]|nr:hypothetical protein H4R35_005886 [Dimargaris xerosporica]
MPELIDSLDDVDRLSRSSLQSLCKVTATPKRSAHACNWAYAGEIASLEHPEASGVDSLDRNDTISPLSPYDEGDDNDDEIRSSQPTIGSPQSDRLNSLACTVSSASPSMPDAPFSARPLDFSKSQSVTECTQSLASSAAKRANVPTNQVLSPTHTTIDAALATSQLFQRQAKARTHADAHQVLQSKGTYDPVDDAVPWLTEHGFSHCLKLLRHEDLVQFSVLKDVTFDLLRHAGLSIGTALSLLQALSQRFPGQQCTVPRGLTYKHTEAIDAMVGQRLNDLYDAVNYGNPPETLSATLANQASNVYSQRLGPTYRPPQPRSLSHTLADSAPFHPTPSRSAEASADPEPLDQIGDTPPSPSTTAGSTHNYPSKMARLNTALGQHLAPTPRPVLGRTSKLRSPPSPSLAFVTSKRHRTASAPYARTQTPQPPEVTSTAPETPSYRSLQQRSQGSQSVSRLTQLFDSIRPESSTSTKTPLNPARRMHRVQFNSVPQRPRVTLRSSIIAPAKKLGTPRPRAWRPQTGSGCFSTTPFRFTPRVVQSAQPSAAHTLPRSQSAARPPTTAASSTPFTAYVRQLASGKARPLNGEQENCPAPTALPSAVQPPASPPQPTQLPAGKSTTSPQRKRRSWRDHFLSHEHNAALQELDENQQVYLKGVEGSKEKATRTRPYDTMATSTVFANPDQQFTFRQLLDDKDPFTTTATRR